MPAELSETLSVVSPLLLPAILAAAAFLIRAVDPRLGRRRAVHEDFTLASSQPDSDAFRAASKALAELIQDTSQDATSVKGGRLVRSANVLVILGTLILAAGVALAAAEAKSGDVSSWPERSIWSCAVVWVIAFGVYVTAVEVDRKHRAESAR